jgi:hypothetical protein
MDARGLADRLRTAAARMDQVLDGLKIASPEVLDHCARLTKQACQDLGRYSSGPIGDEGDAGALQAALELRARIQQARHLLDSVGRFQTRWGQILGGRTGGYLRGGQVAPIMSASRVCLRG